MSRGLAGGDITPRVFMPHYDAAFVKVAFTSQDFIAPVLACPKTFYEKEQLFAVLLDVDRGPML